MNNIPSNYWEIVKDGMYGVANRPNGTAYKSFFDADYKIAAKSGTAQIFSLKENETYNAHKVDTRLRDHKLMTAFAPYSKPCVAVTIILENADTHSIIVAHMMRQILDHILLSKK
ncbi:MrdA protein [Candidatus Pantoea carbekii]|uniref:MrdA protein n=1 Tax=Candidatus Pantoea carbekii TaxID=1235990 RepID=U3U9T8_9GAMM|nr:MrdA protein [Candidatus Pantoea carbekii]